jgi:hypothetical protein
MYSSPPKNMTQKIILDSNIYIADFRMTGIGFALLFDHLRRTKSQILLPEIIREEVTARYVEEYEGLHQKATDAILRFRRALIAEDGGFAIVERPSKEILRKEIQNKLEYPNIFAPTILIDEKGVSIEDVYMRGISRRAPASGKGEELRDVILWLACLQYAKGHPDEDIVFVSTDKGFWKNAGANEARSEILDDIATSGGKIAIFASLERFVKEFSPKEIEFNDESFAEELWADGAIQLLLLEAVADAVADRLGEPINYYDRNPALQVGPIRVTAHSFKSGKAYELGNQSKYIEATYEIKGQISVKSFSVRRRGTLNDLGKFEKGTVNLDLSDATVTHYELEGQAEIHMRLVNDQLDEAGVQEFSLQRLSAKAVDSIELNQYR